MKRRFYKILRCIAKWPLKWIFRVRVEGMENIPKEGGFILCSNHISDMDPVLLIAMIPRVIRFMAKREIFEVFGLRRLVKWLGAFPVDRGAGDFDVLDTAARFVSQGDVLGIFPEGTRSKDGHLGRIKFGIGIVAAKTQADILPVCVMTPGRKRPRPFRKTYITIGEMIPFEELGIEGDSPRAVRGAMKKITGVMKELCGETEEN